MEACLARIAAQLVANMSIRSRIGQLFMIGVDTFRSTPDLERCLRSGKLGGVFVRRDLNTRDTRKLTSFIQSLHTNARAATGALPLLIATDDEGGHFLNYPNIMSPWPNNAAVGASSDGDRAFAYGRGYGEVRKGIGESNRDIYVSRSALPYWNPLTVLWTCLGKCTSASGPM